MNRRVVLPLLVLVAGTLFATGCFRPARGPAPGSLAGRVIVLDPGHNGRNWSAPSVVNSLVFVGNGTKACDTTGTSTDSGLSESAYTFDVAIRTRAILEAAGATVVLTRPDDSGVGPCITERAAIGNRAGAAVAVSIHADGGPAGGRGFHVIIPGPVPGYNDAMVAPSWRFGLKLRDSYNQVSGMPVSTYVGRDGLSLRSDLGGLNLSTVPKVFIETGNMRNGEDAALLGDTEFRDRAAAGIAEGIGDFLNGG